MSKIKVGIAGYGIVGKRRHECIKNNNNMELVAVCDRTFEDNSCEVNNIKCYTNYHDLLKENLDAIFVCLTNDIAAETTIAGLKKGLHVFCEKPPGRDVKDIIKVINIKNKYPTLKLMYGFNHRHHDSVKDALALIHSGKMGKIINMRGVYGKSKLITFNQSDWRTKREISGGGVLLDQGIHLVDLMRLFAGEFVEIKSFLSNQHWGYEVEDNAYALMKTETGVIAMLHSSATQWRHRFNLDINLEKGSVILGGILSGTKSYGSETLTVVNVDHENDSGDPVEQTTTYNHDPSWQDEINLFSKYILDDQAVLSGSPKDALETMKLLYKIYYSDSEWKKLYDIENPDMDKI